MLARNISINRLISLIMIMLFMIFATPTPSVEANAGETSRSVSQGTDYFVQQATVRKSSSVSKGNLFAALLSAFAFIAFLMFHAFCHALRKTHVSFRPRIARRLTHRLLSPIKFTSQFV